MGAATWKRRGGGSPSTIPNGQDEIPKKITSNWTPFSVPSAAAFFSPKKDQILKIINIFPRLSIKQRCAIWRLILFRLPLWFFQILYLVQKVQQYIIVMV